MKIWYYVRKGESAYQESFIPDNFCFMQTFILNLWQNKKVFQNMEALYYIEVLVLNIVETPVEIQGMETLQDLESQHHTQYTVKASV